MGKTRRFWWLKISDDFFNAKEIKFLRKVAGGDTFALIYQRMMILSLNTEGKLYFENIGNTFAEEIAIELDEEVKNVEMTLNYLKGKGLIDFGESDATLEFKQVPSLIGSETNWARYKNQERIKKTEQLENVQSMSNYKEQEQDKDKEQKQDKDLDLDKEEEKEGVCIPSESKIKSLIDYFESEFGQISPVQIEELRFWVFEDKFDIEIIKLSIKEAALNNKRTLKYVKGILRNWRSEGIESVVGVKNREKERFEGKKSKAWSGPEIPLDGPWNS